MGECHASSSPSLPHLSTKGQGPSAGEDRIGWLAKKVSVRLLSYCICVMQYLISLLIFFYPPPALPFFGIKKRKEGVLSFSSCPALPPKDPIHLSFGGQVDRIGRLLLPCLPQDKDRTAQQPAKPSQLKDRSPSFLFFNTCLCLSWYKKKKRRILARRGLRTGQLLKLRAGSLSCGRRWIKERIRTEGCGQAPPAEG